MALLGGQGSIKSQGFGRHDWHFFPVRADLYFPPALATDHARRKGGHLDLVSVIFCAEYRLVSALRIEAGHGETAHTELTDVA